MGPVAGEDQRPRRRRSCPRAQGDAGLVSARDFLHPRIRRQTPARHPGDRGGGRDDRRHLPQLRPLDHEHGAQWHRDPDGGHPRDRPALPQGGGRGRRWVPLRRSARAPRRVAGQRAQLHARVPRLHGRDRDPGRRPRHRLRNRGRGKAYGGLTPRGVTVMVDTYKFIRKGVDEGEYADAGITESLRQLRRRVQGTAEKGLGAAGRTGAIQSSPRRMAPVIGLESSGGGPRTQRGCSCERTAKSGGTTRGGLSSRWTKAFYFFGGAMTIHAFNIIESTLREGEQFAPAHFTPSQKIAIAEMLDEFGVEYLELTSPCASPQSEADLRTVAALPLRAKVLTHVRCHLDDARVAIDTGADGIDVLFGTSSAMREFSHGKTVDQIIEAGTEVVRYIQSQGLEVRFSSEDSFRSEPRDLLRVYQAIDRLHPQRVGLADTVGIATPNQVFELVSMVRKAV